ncbi:MAG TPA: hypothetical protein VIG62_05105 [Blastocatellia bacterium]
MSISRRGFLRAGSIFGVAAIIPRGIDGIAFADSTAGNTISAQANRLAKMTLSKFSAQLNTTFRFRVKGAGWVDFQLVDTKDLRPVAAQSSADDKTECFYLLFHGPAEVPLAQGTYSVKHSELKKFQIFVVPADSDSSGLKYEAHFNRLAS